jgi:hypothetical protein
MAKNYAIAVILAATIAAMSTICYAQEYVNVGGVLIPVVSTYTLVAQTVQVETVLDEGDPKCVHVPEVAARYSCNKTGTAWSDATFTTCRKCTYVKELRDVTVWVEQPSGKVPSEFDVRISSAAKKPKPATIEAIIEEPKP